jgi:hypothetical protein
MHISKLFLQITISQFQTKLGIYSHLLLNSKVEAKIHILEGMDSNLFHQQSFGDAFDPKHERNHLPKGI